MHYKRSKAKQENKTLCPRSRYLQLSQDVKEVLVALQKDELISWEGKDSNQIKLYQKLLEIEKEIVREVALGE